MSRAGIAGVSALAVAGTLLLGATPAGASTTTLTTAGLPGSGPLSAAATARPTTLADAQAQFEARTPTVFAEQELVWATCTPGQFSESEVAAGVLDLGLECATVAVPRDWNDAAAGDPLQIAVSRLPQPGPRPERTVLTNPGGPGGPGLSLAAVGSLPALRGTEVVGIDVRGTGSASVSECGNELTAALNAVPDPRDRTQAALDATAEAVSAGAEVCQDDPVGVVLNTEQTVLDLDLVRALLDRETVDWWGVSAGTWMGAQYATYLPARVGRMVLDSALDVTATWQSAKQLQPMAFQRRFDSDFAPWAAQWSWLFHLGDDAAAVGRTYEEVRAALVVEPLDVPGIGRVDGALLDGLVGQSMYSKQLFEQLAWSMLFLRTAVVARSVGDLVGLERSREQAGSAMAEIPRAAAVQNAAFYTVTCNDTAWSRGQSFWDAEGEAQGSQHPLIGWSLTAEPCGYYDRPSLSLPRPDGKALPDLLVLNSVHDPATAYEGAVRTAAALPSAHLVTVQDEGDHGLYAAGNACVDDTVNAFLLEGVAPGGDVTCEGTGIPAPGSALFDQLRSLLVPLAGG